MGPVGVCQFKEGPVCTNSVMSSPAETENLNGRIIEYLAMFHM